LVPRAASKNDLTVPGFNIELKIPYEDSALRELTSVNPYYDLKVSSIRFLVSKERQQKSRFGKKEKSRTVSATTSSTTRNYPVFTKYPYNMTRRFDPCAIMVTPGETTKPDVRCSSLNATPSTSATW